MLHVNKQTEKKSKPNQHKIYELLAQRRYRLLEGREIIDSHQANSCTHEATILLHLVLCME